MASNSIDMDCEEISKALAIPEDDSLVESDRRSSRGSGKWRGYDARRVFKKEWLMVYNWLAAVPNDSTHAMCKVCGKTIRAHKGDIEKHEKTKRHLRKQSTNDILADLIPITDGMHNDKESLANESKYTDLNASSVTAASEFAEGEDGQQIIYFAESATNASQQNTNTVIDKLVEKYHQTRIKYLKDEHDATTSLHKEKLGVLKQQLEGDANTGDVKNTYLNQEHQIKLKYLGIEHAAKLKSIDDIRDARLRAVEQGLIYARQEFEKKMLLLDTQLSSMRDSGIQTSQKQGGTHIQLAPHINQAGLPSNQCLYH